MMTAEGRAVSISTNVAGLGPRRRSFHSRVVHRLTSPGGTLDELRPRRGGGV